MQGERGSLRDLQRYHRGTDGTYRRLVVGKAPILEEDEIDANKDNHTTSSSKSINVQNIPKTNLSNKSPKAAPRGRRPDKDLIKEEANKEGSLVFYYLLHGFCMNST